MYSLVGACGADQNTCAGLSIKNKSRERSLNADDMVIGKPRKKFLTFLTCDVAVR